MNQLQRLALCLEYLELVIYNCKGDVSLKMHTDESGEIIHDNGTDTCDCGQGCHHEIETVLEYYDAEMLEMYVNEQLDSYKSILGDNKEVSDE